MTSRMAIACCAVGVVLGVGGSWLLGRSGDAPSTGAPDRSAQAARGDRAAPVRIEARGGARPDEIRSVVAEEVRAALREQAGAGAPAPSAEAAAAAAAPAAREAPEPTAAFAQVKGRVAERLAQGAWTASDRDWM